MNKYMIKLILAVLGGSLFCCSCNDWLDVEPNTEMDRNDLFKDEAGFADAMSGVYANMTDNNLYGKNLTWYMLELMGGGATYTFGNNGNFAGYYFHKNSSYYMESLKLSDVDPIWNKIYNTIANLNSLLACIDDKQNVFGGDDYAVFKGEALGLRAFLHFDLLRLFGEAGAVNPDHECIPYVGKLTSEVHPLLTVKQCSECILADLKEARKLLEADPMYTDATPSSFVCSAVTGNSSYRTRYGIRDWHNRRFHFNYYAAVATMACVYLWMGNKEEALACAKEVIAVQETVFPWVNSTLVQSANIENTDKYGCKDPTFCTEQIFALNITDLHDRMDGYMLEGEYAFQGQYGNLLAINTADAFEPATQALDPRYAYLKKAYSMYGNEFMLSTKYYKRESESPWAADRLPLMRASEMYYIAAECESDWQEGVKHLETVRSHRGLSSAPLRCGSKDDLQNEIEKEYRKEFIAEGQLFYYFKRLNKSVTIKSPMSGSKTIEPNCFTLDRPDDENTYGGRNKDNEQTKKDKK